MPTKLGPVFSDKIVSPTELARNVSKITHSALQTPITIHRPEGDLAMLARHEVAELVAAARASEMMVRVMRSFLSTLHQGTELPPGLEWLAVFDQKDVEDFVDEYVSAVERTLAGLEDWDYPAAVVHEWQESARALYNRELLEEVAAFRDVASAEEASSLPVEELRKRLSRHVENSAR